MAKWLMNMVKELAEYMASGRSNSRIYFGHFLDEFYRVDNESRQMMVNDEPDIKENITKKKLAFIAATVEQLCRDYKLEIPDWVDKHIYFLQDPYFDLNAKGDLRLLLMIESPQVFKRRNIFTTRNALSRV